MSERAAKYLAIILGPHVWLPILFVLIIIRSGLSQQQLLIIFPSVLTLQVVIPILYLLLAPKLGWVGEWDMKLKEERRPFFILIVALTSISLVIIYLFGNSFLLHLNIIFFSLLAMLFTITNFWKISLHTSLNTAVAVLVNFLFDWRLPLLYLIVPVIFWARLKLKKHTISQLIAGILVTSTITLFGLRLFNYL